MTTINVYLTFDGECEEAFAFYKSLFGGEYASISKFKDMPPNPDYTPTPEEAERIMHVSLPISKETILMGSDNGAMSPPLVKGNNFSISINAESKEKADRFFQQLSAGGAVIMPMAETFWGSYFGMAADKYGIQWMVSFGDGEV